MPHAREMLRPRDVAPRLGVSPRRVYQLVREGGLPAIRQGRAIRIPRAAFEQWLADCATRALSAVLSATDEARPDGR